MQTLAGYSALIEGHGLSVPAPDSLCAIGTKHKKYDKGRWRIFTPRHKPGDSLYGHLTFALKYEGVDLGLLKPLFEIIEPEMIAEIVRSEPTDCTEKCTTRAAVSIWIQDNCSR